ncbi:MAG TPA: septal ring lytic transglycosylase RlpA family protein [Polyangiaceae bacterium]|jgi:rare lipoprotein A
MMKQTLLLLIVTACGAAATESRPAAETKTETSAGTSTATAPATATVAATATATAAVPLPPRATSAVYQRGYASWYGAVLAGNHTANGEIFDPSKLTAAHRTLKLGTWLEVRRTDNGRYVRVKVNDRGPVSHRFVIDLSSGAARQLGMLRMGVAPVELRIVPAPQK